MRVLSVALLSCALLLLTVAGCPGGGSADAPDLVPVSGTVTLDGEPLSGASVMFGGIAYGNTEENGRYELTYRGQEKGVPTGEYPVVCEKWVMPDGSDYTGEISPMEAGAEQLLPPRYSDDTQTELKATVPAGGGTIDFKLTSGP